MKAIKQQSVKKTVFAGIELLLIRKRIKNMYLRIIPPEGEVRLTAPLRASNKDLENFVIKNADWVHRKCVEIQRRPVASPLEYVSGERHFLWGIPYELFVEQAKRNSVSIEGNYIVLKITNAGTPEDREKVMNEWYRRELKKAIGHYLPDCELITGKQASDWGVRNMRTRWGTCNVAKKRIWLNLQLAKKSTECLKYVIIHELVHLYERHHNARFHGYMDKFCPGWREIREKLNKRNEN
ncbi:MAG: M48 family metallopeptidase [Butyrivibrio sp.]|nr:M48 family metallopeptidase [Butyrivibrio sp.]